MPMKTKEKSAAALFPIMCDECDEPILTAKGGWLEWCTDPESGRASAPRNVHHVASSPRGPRVFVEGGQMYGGCYGPPRRSGDHLHHVLEARRRSALGREYRAYFHQLRDRALPADKAEWDAILGRLGIPARCSLPRSARR